jgi:hypothetical protein
MFAISEAALAIRDPDYTWTYAILGMVSEAIYLPLSALVARRFLTD